MEAAFRILPQKTGETPGEALNDIPFKGDRCNLIDSFLLFTDPDQLPKQLRFANAADALDQALAT